METWKEIGFKALDDTNGQVKEVRNTIGDTRKSARSKMAQAMRKDRERMREKRREKRYSMM